MAVLSIGQVWADPAAVGTTLFSEDFSGYAKDAVPSGSVTTATGRVVYGNGSVTYTCTASGTKIYNENTGGGTAPEILVAKNGGTFAIAGIPSGGAQVITVSLTQNNQALSVEPSGTGYSGSVSGKPGAVGTRTFDITVADGADATFTLTFTGSGSSNVRVDNILVTVKTAGEGAAPTCATPTFDPEDGETFSDDIDVEIASATDGATIYYTTDGEDPTTSSDVYTTALNFTETTTLKAMAVKEGSNNSAVATATYTKIVPFSGSILEITKDDFVASYASNNGEHEKDGVTYYTNQVCLSSSSIQFQKSNGLLYNKTDLGEIAKIEITKTGDNNLLVYSGTTENPTTGEVTGSASGSVTTYTFASGKGFFAIKCNSTALSQVTPIKIYYVYSAPAVVAPTISGETPFSTSTTVSITHADADHIYYTTNGVDPTTSSTEYTVPFTVDADGTTIVKAIAVKGGDVSAVASKEFEKVASYTTLADIFTKATEVENTATDIYVTFGGWKVSAKTSNNVFLTDGTNGAVIYGSGHGFNAGDVLTGTVACKVQLYKGFAELTSLNSATPGLTVTPGSVGDPVVKTWDQLSAVNTGALVTLENLTYDGSSLSDGVNTIPTYTTFYTATFEAGKSYNLTGVYQYYNTDGQILPRNASDVVEIIETYTVTYNNAPDHGTLTIKNGDDVVASGSSVNEGTVLTIVTTPAEDYKLAGVTVNGNAYTESTLTLSENVTIAATFEENLAPEVETYILSEAGVQTSHLVSGMRVGDKVNLPLTAAECSKVFRGWSENASCAVAPEYAPGALYSLKADNKLYAVYATATPGAVTNYPIDFENETTDYTDWSFDNMTSQGTNSGVTAHGGSYFGTTGGKATASVTTTAKIANPSSITFYVSKQSTNTTASSWKVEVSSDGSDWTQVGDAQSATSMSKGEWIEVTRDLSAHSDVYVRVYYGSNTAVRCIDDLVLSAQGPDSYSDYSTDCQAQVKTPTFSPAAGTYTEVQNVTISTETADAAIYYTINGEEPSTSSTLYEGAIEVGEDMTIKAIAVKSEMANSAVATAEYEINLPLSTVDAIFAKAKEVKSTETDVTVTFGNWVVSATKDANAYVTDGTKGFIIYANNHGFNVGDVLSGTADCKVKLYAGSAELTMLTATTEGLNVAEGGTVTPVAKNYSDLDSINTGALVVLNGLFYNGSKLVDASENEITPYNAFYSEMALKENHVYNITGIYVQYYATKEIAPRAAADVVDVTEYVKVSFDANANDATGDLPEDVTGLIAGHNSYTIPTEKPLSREAYLQIGWNTDKDAEVALEGNLTNITADATLYAIWTAKATCAIKFYDRGNEYASKSPYQGVEYTIDVDDPEAPSGYTFAGWSASQIATEATSATLVTKVTPADEPLSFYAVYTRSEGDTVIVYNKVTEAPADWAGKYLIVSEDFNVAFDGSLETLDAANDVIEVTINEGVIAGSDEVNAAVFTVAAATSNYSIRSASGFYIGQTANSNGLSSSTTTVYTNTLAISEGDAVITSSGNPTLRYNKASDQNRFRYYKSGQQPVQLYKQHVTLPTVYYTTAPVNRYTVSFNLAEDEQGSFSPISVVEGEDATLPAEVPTKLHNTFNKWKDANNNEYAAEATIENVTSNIVLSATWTENSKANVTFDANGGSDVAAINDVYEGETYNLPDAPTYGTNIFGGWKVGDNVYAAGTEMTMSTPAAAVTYTAQWTVVPEFNAGYWFKVTDASTLAAGQFVIIVAEDADYALGATQNSNNRSADAISKIANPAAAYYATAPAIILLQNGLATGQFGLYVTNGETKGYLYAAASGSNHMKTQDALDDNASWEIAIENGVTTVIATDSENRNNLLYNSGSVIFSCYTGTSSSIKNVAIYRYEESNKLQVSYAGKGTEHVQGALVNAGGSVTLAAAPAAPEAEDVTYSFVSWIVDGVEYAPAAEIANITENKVVYAKWNVETKNTATDIIIPVEDVVASDIHVKENQTVTVEVTEDVTLGNLDLENGAILEFDVTPGATVEANDLILRSSSADRDQHQGMSSQAPVMPVVNGVLALEIELRPDEMNAENSSLWYCIAAPFDVDINNGFEWVHPNGSRTPMVHNVDFQIFEYDGARRATGISGWKRISGTMKAGVAHFIGFDNARTNQNTIRLTAKTNTVASTTAITLGSYPGASDVQNWNGVANPTMQYIGINKDIVAFDYGIQDYNTYASTAYNYFVGSPFFIQQDGGSIAIDYDDRNGAIHAPKREVENLEYCVRINAANANSFESQMYVRASETASYSYEEGHDLASQCSTTPKYGARIWTENYNVRLGIEEAPLTNGNATYVLGIATPSAGEYTISVAAPKENADLYLTYNGSIIWNLSEGAYTVELPKGVTSGYGLVLQAKAPQVITGVDNAEANEAGVQKVIINDHVYILRAEQMYDVTGKMVK